MAAVSSATGLRGADYENGLRGGPGSAGAGQDPGEDDPMGRGGLELDLELLGPGRRSRRIGGRVATGRRSGGRGSTGSGGAGGLEELEEDDVDEEEPGELSGDPAIEDPVRAAWWGQDVGGQGGRRRLWGSHDTEDCSGLLPLIDPGHN